MNSQDLLFASQGGYSIIAIYYLHIAFHEQLFLMLIKQRFFLFYLSSFFPFLNIYTYFILVNALCS